MSQIVSGKVTYGRTVQPAQYESKKAEVEISFVIGEGEELGDMLDRAAQLAEAKALELVGLRKSSTERASVATATTPAPGTNGKTPDELKAEHAAKEAAPKPAKRPPAPKKDEVKPNISATPEDRKDPAEMVDEVLSEPATDPIAAAKAKVAAAAKAVEDAQLAEAKELAEMMGETAAPAEPITDAALIEAVRKKNTTLAAANAGIPQPRKIKELIAKYATHAHSIAQEKRQEFLDKLEALS